MDFQIPLSKYSDSSSSSTVDELSQSQIPLYSELQLSSCSAFTHNTTFWEGWLGGVNTLSNNKFENDLSDTSMPWNPEFESRRSMLSN